MEAAYQDKKLKGDGWGKQPTALVAGGTGFLGAYLCEALISQKINVICIDTSLEAGASKKIEHLLSLPNFTFWQEDITKPGFTLSPNVPLTYVFHLVSVEEYLVSDKISIQTLIVNSLGTKNLLDVALDKKAKFIFASSTEVLRGAISQTSLSAYFGENVDSTELSFGEAKRFAEALVAEYFKNYDLAANIVRLKDPYGPGMDLTAGNQMANLISQAINKNKIEIVGDGLKILNPTYVTDIIFGLIKTALQGGKGEIINLINPEKKTERSVAEALKRVIGNIEIVFKEKTDTELPYPQLILPVGTEKISWLPKTSLDQGLSETSAFYKESKEKGEKKPPVLTQTIPAAKTEIKSEKKRLARILTALFSIALIFWTVFLPIINLATSSYFANQNLNTAVDKLLIEETKDSMLKAEKAEGLFKSGEKATENITWIAKILRLNESRTQIQNYLSFGETLATTTKYTALSISTIKEATNSNMSAKEIDEKLKTAQDNISLARRNLDISASVSMNESKLITPFRDEYRDLVAKKNILEELIKSLEESVTTEF